MTQWKLSTIFLPISSFHHILWACLVENAEFRTSSHWWWWYSSLSPGLLNKYCFVANCRAKTIKNTVSVNEELTAEEWKRRYEKEKDKNTRLRGMLERYQAELTKWRAGEQVTKEEQNSLAVSGKDALTPSDSTTNLTAMIKASGGTISDAERIAWEQEKQRLYQQLDDKVPICIQSVKLRVKGSLRHLDRSRHIFQFLLFFGIIDCFFWLANYLLMWTKIAFPRFCVRVP